MTAQPTATALFSPEYSGASLMLPSGIVWARHLRKVPSRLKQLLQGFEVVSWRRI